MKGITEIAINPLEIGFMMRAARRINYKPQTKFIPLAVAKEVQITKEYVINEYRAMKKPRQRIPIHVSTSSMNTGDYPVISNARLVYSSKQKRLNSQR